MSASCRLALRSTLITLSLLLGINSAQGSLTREAGGVSLSSKTPIAIGVANYRVDYNIHNDATSANAIFCGYDQATLSVTPGPYSGSKYNPGEGEYVCTAADKQLYCMTDGTARAYWDESAQNTPTITNTPIPATNTPVAASTSTPVNTTAAPTGISTATPTATMTQLVCVDYPSVVLASSPYQFYRFQETTPCPTTGPVDEMGLGNGLFSTVSCGVTGPVVAQTPNVGFSTADTNAKHYVALKGGAVGNFVDNSMAWGGWFKWTHGDGFSTCNIIFSRGSMSTGFKYSIKQDDSAGTCLDDTHVRCCVHTETASLCSNPATDNADSPTGNLAGGGYHQIICYYDGVHVGVFIDGRKSTVADVAITGNLISDTHDPILTCRQGSTVERCQPAMSVDEVMIWDAVPSVQQIANIYNASIHSCITPTPSNTPTVTNTPTITQTPSPT
jgi:hypothetical protein